jgi:hypothetical protein
MEPGIFLSSADSFKKNVQGKESEEFKISSSLVSAT